MNWIGEHQARRGETPPESHRLHSQQLQSFQERSYWLRLTFRERLQSSIGTHLSAKGVGHPMLLLAGIYQPPPIHDPPWRKRRRIDQPAKHQKATMDIPALTDQQPARFFC